MRNAGTLLIGLMFLIGAGPTTETAAVDVELTVRAPDERPVAHADLSIRCPPDRQHREQKLELLSARTDENGVARFKVAPGHRALGITVPGIGYGDTGWIEFVPGEIAHPDLAPLVPFGTISGSVPAELLTPDLKVLAGRKWRDDEEKQLQATPDAQGRFTFSDVRAGLWWVDSGNSTNPHVARADGELRVFPGEQKIGVALKPTPPSPTTQSSGAIRRAPLPGQGQTVTWAKGTVRDTSGHPIPNAVVYAMATYYGGIRNYEQSVRATTDAAGHYELRGPGGLDSFSQTLLVSVPDRPPAWAWPAYPRPQVEWIAAELNPPVPPAPPGPIQDFVIANSGGLLDVTVFLGGKAQPGAVVGAYLQNANLRDIWAAGGGELHEAMDDVAHPVAVADAQGVAHFSNLLPGSYDIHSCQGDKSAIRSAFESGGSTLSQQQILAVATGISIQSSRRTSLAMALRPSAQTSLRLLETDGSPRTERTAFSYGPRDQVSWNSSIEFDQDGLIHERFSDPGLWRIELSYRHPDPLMFPLEPPYLGAIATVAVSASLSEGYVPIFNARPISVGSVRISVIDDAGRPLQVPVELDRPLGKAIVSGGTDGNGQFIYSGLVHQFAYVARAFAPGLAPADLGSGDEPLPAREKLSNRTEILAESVMGTLDTQIKLKLSSQKVAYITGTIRLPAGWERREIELYVYPDSSMLESGCQSRVRTSNGEYVVGPFRPGAVVLNVMARDGQGQEMRTRIQTQVEGGELKDLPISLAASPSLGQVGTTMIGIGGMSASTVGAQRLNGRVLRADGTPAFGAQVLYFEPGQAQPTIAAFTDVSGALHPRGLWRNLNAVPPGTPLGPDAPTLLAMLPGECGATVTPAPEDPGAPLNLVLIPPISVSGQVHIDRKTPVPGNGTIHIHAACQDHGVLNPYLSLVTTANTDGRFTLSGLTPGKYLVQAALDDIWLSSSVALNVTTDGKLSPLELSIGAPGAPVLVYLRDRAGKVAPGRAVSIDLPPGPLTNALWPSRWTSDGAGVVYIPTLPAGPVTIRTDGNIEPIVVNVAPLPATQPVEVHGVVGSPTP